MSGWWVLELGEQPVSTEHQQEWQGVLSSWCEVYQRCDIELEAKNIHSRFGGNFRTIHYPGQHYRGDILHSRCLCLHHGELAWEAAILLTCGLECYHAWGHLASGVRLCLLRHLQLIKALFPELSIVSEVIWAWLWKLLCYQFMLTSTYSILKVLSFEAIKNNLPSVAIILYENPPPPTPFS